MNTNIRGAVAQRPGPSVRAPASRNLAATAQQSLLARLRRFEFAAYISFFKKQPPSFWLISAYLLFEYVRPQTLYPAIDILPWSEWTMVGCLGALVLEGKIAQRWDRSEGFLVLMLGIVLASSWFAFNPSASWRDIKVPLSWGLVYLLITRSVRSEEQYFVFYLLFLVFSLKMSQHASRSWVGAGMQFRSWGAVGAPGWFRNSGEMAIQMALFLPLSAYFVMGLKPYLTGLAQRWKYWAVMLIPISAVMALLASSSRGGQLGGAAVVLFMTLRSRQRWRGLMIGAVVCVFGYLLLPDQQIQRFTEMGDDKTSQARFYYWEIGVEVTKDNPVLGVGYENWLGYFATHYPPFDRTYEQPHNIFIEAAAELGYVGLLGFLLLIGFTFRMNYLTRRRVAKRPHGRVMYYMALGLDAALIGYMVSGFFVTVLWYPYFWVNYAMTAALFKVARDERRGVRYPGKVAAPAGRRPLPRGGPRTAGAPSR